jgi:hypothetical protein
MAGGFDPAEVDHPPAEGIADLGDEFLGIGVIAADDNTRGVGGAAPSIASLRATSHWDGATPLHVADAIVAALPTMSAGHVLLLEVQRGAAPLPTETDAGDFDAIRLATARGIIVVEAAGNGNNDLDAFTDGRGRCLRRVMRISAIQVDRGSARRTPVVGGNAQPRGLLEFREPDQLLRLGRIADLRLRRLDWAQRWTLHTRVFNGMSSVNRGLSCSSGMYRQPRNDAVTRTHAASFNLRMEYRSVAPWCDRSHAELAPDRPGCIGPGAGRLLARRYW